MAVASPELTGAAGPTYESQVVALYLADLLLEGGVRGLEGTSVRRVAVQRAALRAPLDDIIVVGQRQDGIEAEFHLQVKRELTLTASQTNAHFRDVVHAAWDTFTAPAFRSGIYRIGGVTEYISPEKHRAAAALHRAAKYSHDGTELRARLDVPGLFGEPIQAVAAAVSKLIEERAGRRPSNDELWQFWQHFIILHIETSAAGARDRHYAVERLRGNLPGSEASRAVDLFDALESIAREMATTAGSVDRQTLLDRLGGRFPVPSRILGRDDTIETLSLAARSATAQDIKAFMREMPQSTLFISIGLELYDDNPPQAISQTDLIARLRSLEDVVLEAPPGAGKSTTLIQIAEGIIAETVDRIPVLLPLPELAIGQRALLEEVAQRAPFRSLELESLQRLSEAGRLILLMDGWNELAPEQKTFVRYELQKFRRGYANNSILLATRPQTPAPPVGADPKRRHLRVSLSQLTEAQQLTLLSAGLGNNATDFYHKANYVPGLRDILRTPLYAQAIASSPTRGELPTTKEEVIRHLVDTHERNETHRDELDKALLRSHGHFLRRIGTYMTEREITALREIDLRREISLAASELISLGQIVEQPEPLRVIDALVAHHVLVERLEVGDKRVFGFQHQQFQEWFASFHVEDCMVQATTPESTGVAFEKLDDILDRTSWEEALLFAVERLSRRGDAAPHAVARAILRALGIDPMLAAEMIHRSTTEVWAIIADATLRFADNWLANSKADRVLAFMLASGRPEFATRVWRLFEDQDIYREAVRLRDQSRFVPSTLGTNARDQIKGLVPDRRSELLWDLVSNGGQEGIELAVEVARNEPSAHVLASVIDVLEFVGSDQYVAELLARAPTEVWRLLAQRRSLEYLPEPLAARLRSERISLAQSLPPGRQRLWLLLKLSQAVDSRIDPNELIREALNTKLDDIQFPYDFFLRISEQHPDALSREVVAWTLDRRQVPFAVQKHVRTAEEQQQPMMLELVSDPKTETAVRHVAARSLDLNSVSLLIRTYLALDEALDQLRSRNHPSGNSASQQEDLSSRNRATFEALEHAQIEALIGAIVEMPAAEPRTIAACAQMISQWRDNDRDRKTLPVPPLLTEQLRDRVKTWAECLTETPDVSRYALSAVASVIKLIAEPSLLPELKRLLDRDLALWRAQRARRAEAWSRGHHDPIRDSEAMTSYVEMYRQAFEAFDAELVRNMLLSYLDDEDFAVPAAILLRRSGGRRLVSEREDPFRQQEWSLIADRRRERTSQLASAHRQPAHPVASAVLDRVKALLTIGTETTRKRAIELATVATQMVFGDRLITIEAAITATRPDSGRYSLLRGLLLAGESLRPEWVVAGLNEALDQLTGKFWQPDQVWWQIERWLELAAFTLPSSSIIEVIKRLPSGMKHPYQMRKLINALSFSGASDAVATLDALADEIPTLVGEYSWLKSLVRLGSEEAARLFVRTTFDDDRSRMLLRELGRAESLAELLQRYPSVFDELLERIGHAHSQASQAIVAQIVPAMRDQQMIVALLEIARQEDRGLLRAALVRAVEELAVSKRPMEGSRGVYEQEPAELAWLRARLFEAVRAGGPASGVATALLVTIDRSRDMYGRPSAERRHPDISSKVPWPLEALETWATTQA
jgi:hypothetical protein